MDGVEPGKTAGDLAAGRTRSWLRMNRADILSVRGFRKASLAVTEIRYDAADFGVSDPMSPVDAIAVGLQLRPHPLHELWYAGKAGPVRDVQRGDTLLCDLRAVEQVHTSNPFHTLQLFLPREFLDEIAAETGSPPIDELKVDPRLPQSDPAIRRMARIVQPLLSHPEDANELFATHFIQGLGAYVCTRYCGLARRKASVGGLSAWQERTAKDIIGAHLDGALSLDEIAAGCGLSTGHFARAFRQTVGMPPHQWLLRRRIDRAKAVLASSASSLADVAVLCGFVDQSHFTRVFRKVTGATPGAWLAEISL
jgi:AraC family transcriptional regulator